VHAHASDMHPHGSLPAADLAIKEKRNTWQAVMSSGLTPHHDVLGHLHEGDHFGRQPGLPTTSHNLSLRHSSDRRQCLRQQALTICHTCHTCQWILSSRCYCSGRRY
jgi:hypothetical protein